MPEPALLKTCLFLSPVGAHGSEMRFRMGGVFREVVEPVTRAAGYLPEIRVDDAAPGRVTADMVISIKAADLVVADLHGQDPNVMYGMAIRHTSGRPIVHMTEDGQPLPLDLAGPTTITYRPSLHGLSLWKGDLEAAIAAATNGDVGANPVSRSTPSRGIPTPAAPREEVVLDELLLEVLLKILGALAPSVSALGFGVETESLMELLRERGIIPQSKR